VGSFQVFGFLFFVLRSLEILNHIPALGEVFLILREMIYDSLAVTVYMFAISGAAGIAFHSGMPPVENTPGHPTIDARHWGFASLWAILG
jgi:hypothetical protein